MNERLVGLTRESVQTTMRRIEPQESYSALLSQELQQTVYGQSKAADAVARRLALFDTGLSDPKRPLGVMMFLGPSGVGKTEMAHAAAKQMFGDTHSDRLKIINMAELTEQHDTKRFVGSPPSYVGWNEKPLIPHEWLHKGRSIIVLDELEKAHPAVIQLFLGALDKGTMDARVGQSGTQPLDFRNTLFIITSNIGGRAMHDAVNGTGAIGFKTPEGDGDTHKRIEQIAQKGLKDHLSPEFLNRIDDIVVFEEITDRAIHRKIFDKFVAYRNHDLEEARHAEAPYFGVTEEFREYILDTVGNKGGREMKRELERRLFDKAADVFMGLDVKGRPLVADVDPGTNETVFYTDDVPLEVAEKKGEQRDTAISTPTGGNESSAGTPKPIDTQTEEKERVAGEAEKPPKEPTPVDSYEGDSGDEDPPELRMGMQIRIWDESKMDEEGNVPYAFLNWRDLVIPTK